MNIEIDRVMQELTVTHKEQVIRAIANPKLRGWFVGQIMKELGGKANPKEVNDVVHSKLDSLAANVEKSGKSRGIRLPYTDTPKRNKQVDVPTEAWQKNVERRVHALEKRMGRMEEDHISLIAYLSNFHGLDINEWNDWKNNTRMLPDKVYYNEHGLIEDCRHTDTRMWNTEADFWNAEYKDLKTGA